MSDSALSARHMIVDGYDRPAFLAGPGAGLGQYIWDLCPFFGNWTFRECISKYLDRQRHLAAPKWRFGQSNPSLVDLVAWCPTGKVALPGNHRLPGTLGTSAGYIEPLVLVPNLASLLIRRKQQATHSMMTSLIIAAGFIHLACQRGGPQDLVLNFSRTSSNFIGGPQKILWVPSSENKTLALLDVVVGLGPEREGGAVVGLKLAGLLVVLGHRPFLPHLHLLLLLPPPPPPPDTPFLAALAAAAALCAVARRWSARRLLHPGATPATASATPAITSARPPANAPRQLVGESGQSDRSVAQKRALF
uniref:Uncharacterized protein n=1 Tax=Pyricularia oryzae (strain P131) TaxID=1143193 RepID=L7JA66_PYRO1